MTKSHQIDLNIGIPLTIKARSNFKSKMTRIILSRITNRYQGLDSLEVSKAMKLNRIRDKKKENLIWRKTLRKQRHRFQSIRQKGVKKTIKKKYMKKSHNKKGRELRQIPKKERKSNLKSSHKSKKFNNKFLKHNKHKQKSHHQNLSKRMK
jgi:hypothetical protein